MISKPVEQARTRELALALPALRRARQRADEIAIATNKCIVEVHDGRIVDISPDELKARGRSAADRVTAFERARLEAAEAQSL